MAPRAPEPGPSPAAAAGRRALLAALLVLAACTDAGSDRELASRCLRAFDDPHARLTARSLSGYEVRREGDEVVVRTRTPAGVGLDARVKFREREYRCRVEGDALRFLGYRRL